jgi:transcriptional regulator with XRE-family HTH domain
MRNLKQRALASLAGVSLSSIERIERAEEVTDAILDKVAVALGRSEGEFTTPRIPIPREEAVKLMCDSFKPFLDKVTVPVAPLRLERQVRALANTEFGYVFAPELEPECSGELADLREWVEFISFIIGYDRDPLTPRKCRADCPKPRKLYRDFLAAVRRFEIETDSVVLCGTYEAKTNHSAMPTAKVGVVRAFPRSTDPGAIKRNRLLLPPDIDVQEIWRRFIRGGDAA